MPLDSGRKGSAAGAHIGDPAAILAAKNSLRGKKANLTRKINEVTELIGDIPPQGEGDTEFVPSLTTAEDAVYNAQSSLSDTLEQLMELDPDNFKDYDETMSTASNAARKAIRDCVAAKARIKAAENRRGASPGPRNDRDGDKPRPVDSLRPQKLTKDATPADFRTWKAQFKAYFEASRFDRAPPAQQQAYLKVCLDAELADTITATVDEDAGGVECLDIVCRDFKARYPTFNKRVEYFNIRQRDNESFSATLVRIKNQESDADIRRISIDELRVFRSLTAVTDAKLRQELIKTPDLNFVKLEDTVAKYEAAKAADKAVNGASGGGTAYAAYDGDRHTAAYVDRPPSSRSGNRARICNRCGINAPPQYHYETCPAVDHRCDKCGKRGHFEKICYSSGSVRRPNNGDGDRFRNRSASRDRNSDRSPSRGRQESRFRSQSRERGPRMRPETPYRGSSGDRGSSERINKIGGSNPTPRMRLVIHPDNSAAFPFECLPDTGATKSVMAANVAYRHGVRLSDAGGASLSAANGEPLVIVGRVAADAKQGDVRKRIDFWVTSSIRDEILISWVDLKRLGAISEQFPQANVTAAITNSCHETDSQLAAALQNKLINKYQHVLRDDLPKEPMAGPPMKIHLKPDNNVKPCRILTARQVPVHHKKDADKLVESLLADGIIERVSEPTEWINPAFFVVKPGGGGLRLVADLTQLNKACLRVVKPFPSAAEIVARIPADAKYFAKLDAVQGYHQIALDEESSYLTTFLLPQGKFRYLRAPMGAAPSSDEWCVRSDVVVDNVEDTMKLVDDILVAAPSLSKLEKRTDTVLERCAAQGITISKKKFVISDEVNFAGYVIGRDSIRPDPERTEAISDFPTPKSTSDLRGFLGLAQQLGSFVPDLAHVTDDLRKLLKKGVEFVWLPEHDEAFRKAKEILTNSVCTSHFNPSLKTVLMTDASRLHGLGFALMQYDDQNRPKLIQCGSRSLSTAEANYAVIETEMLAVQWAVNKCHHYLAGADNFTVATDHRPLVGIFAKRMDDVTNPRIVRLREKLARYSFTTAWVEGKTHCVADALSRAPIWDGNKCDEACAALVAARPADSKVEDLSEKANADDRYNAIKEAIGKPLTSLPPGHPAKELTGVWNTIGTTAGGLLVVDGSRILVPAAARAAILKTLHKPHAGIDKTKQAARQLYYWPGMTDDIAAMVNGCEACQKHKPSSKALEMVHTFADRPMEQISADLFDYAGKTYAAVADRYSGYIWVKPMKGQTAAVMIEAMEEITNDNGLPLVIRTDNGPCYRGPFARWCESSGIKHETSSPHHAPSNGHAENAVKTAKQLMDKTGGYGADYRKALAEWRNTPRQDGTSPAQMYFGRRQRTSLPALETAYQPIDTDAVARKRRMDVTGGCEDVAEHDLKVGDHVYVQDPATSKWTEKGTVTGLNDTGRSYQIHFENGRIASRNRTHIRPRQTHQPETEVSETRNAPIQQADDEGQRTTGSGAASDAGAAPGDESAKGHSDPGPRRSSRLRKPKVHFDI